MSRASHRLRVKGFVRVGIAVALAWGAWPLSASAQSAGSIWWQLPTQLAPPGEGFYGITCASTSLCLATAAPVQAGSLSDVASSTDPTGGASAWRFDPVDRNTRPLPDGDTFPAGLNGISCPSVSLCVG